MSGQYVPFTGLTLKNRADAPRQSTMGTPHNELVPSSGAAPSETSGASAVRLFGQRCQPRDRADDLSPWFNAACNVGWIVAFYMILGAVHLQIPAADRARRPWCWVIFAPFYPGRLWIMGRLFRGRKPR